MLRVSTKGAFNLLMVMSGLTFLNSIGWVLFFCLYVPARQKADDDMADLLRETQRLLRVSHE